MPFRHPLRASLLALLAASGSAVAEPVATRASPQTNATAGTATAQAQTDAFKPQDNRSTDPSFGPETLARTHAAVQKYEGIVAQGGWQKLPEIARGLKQGQNGPLVKQLKARLVISGDLDPSQVNNPQFDATTAQALKVFQARHGLSETGSVGRLTFAALNVPADVRLKQLRATTERLQNNVFKFAPRYMVVNIPGAVVEAVSKGKVERRHLAVVGKKERQSPVISANISQIVVNPHWTVPNSIIRKDIVTALKTDPTYLHKNNLRTLNWKGEEVDPNTVRWSATQEPNFLLRQDPGPQNSLGQIKIDMPNAEAVYMHDTPKKELFNRDVRFHSSGCARISDIRDLAEWLVAEQGIDKAQIDERIATGQKQEIKLKRHVPVAWVYLTGWGDGEGRVQFREDIYDLDTPEGVRLTTLDGKKKIRPPSIEDLKLAAKRKQIAVAKKTPTAQTADQITTGSVPVRAKTTTGQTTAAKATTAKATTAAPKPTASKASPSPAQPLPPKMVNVAATPVSAPQPASATPVRQ
jgi:L,D-transpeptidase YcbB